MNIAEIKKFRSEVERELTTVIADAIQNFQQETELTVEDIYIDFVEIHAIGYPREKKVSGVRIQVSI